MSTPTETPAMATPSPTPPSRNDDGGGSLQARRLEAIGRLAGGIAHDFNNVLSVVLCHAEMGLRDTEPGSVLRAHVEEVIAACHRAAELTHQLLDFSRPGPPRPQALDVAQVLRDLERMVRRILGTDVQVLVEAPPSLPAAWVDRAGLDHALLHLVANARDAMPDGGRLVIAASVERHGDEEAGPCRLAAGRHVVIEVSDTGTGMTGDALARAVEPLFRARQDRIGLGLSTAVGVVSEAGGLLRVECVPGQGTHVQICLPVLEDVAAPGSGPLACAPGHETVLLVEDDDMLRLVTETTLRRLGYDVVGAGGADEAAAAAEQSPPDVILLDVVTGPGSQDLRERLRALAPHAAVILTSGYDHETLVQRGLLEPGTPYLQKPVAPGVLGEALRRALEEARRGRGPAR